MTHRTALRARPLGLACLLATLLLVGALAAPRPARAETVPAPGLPATVSADLLPTWQINGVVWSQVVVRGVVYATGSFTRARPPGVPAGGAGEIEALNLFAYSLGTGQPVTTFRHRLNGQGRTLAASPDGTRVYVGGDFTTVDGAAHGHVAAFDTATGAVVGAFRASTSGAVRALSATTTRLFVGGSFATVNGRARARLAAVTSSTGGLQAWAPRAGGGSVMSMVLAPGGSRVVVGGSFTTLNGAYAYGMGSVSSSTGATLPWAANRTIKDATASGAITSLRTDGRRIYGSGYAYGAGSSFEGTFAAEPLTGALTLVNDCHGDTYDVAAVGGVLYSVGHAHDCRAIGSFPDTSPRVRWQRVLAQTTTATRKNLGPDSYGWNYAGLPASTVLHWFPQIAAGTYTGQSQGAWTVSATTSYLVLGGEFPSVNGTRQQGLARFALAAYAPNRRGPTYATLPPRAVPATTATSPAAGSVTVRFGTAWDYDNGTLTYDVRRDGTTWVSSTRVRTNFWTLPARTFTDTGLARGSTHYYDVRIRDPWGNTIWAPRSNAVTTS